MPGWPEPPFPAPPAAPPPTAPVPALPPAFAPPVPMPPPPELVAARARPARARPARARPARARATRARAARARATRARAGRAAAADARPTRASAGGAAAARARAHAAGSGAAAGAARARRMTARRARPASTARRPRLRGRAPDEENVQRDQHQCRVTMSHRCWALGGRISRNGSPRGCADPPEAANDHGREQESPFAVLGDSRFWSFSKGGGRSPELGRQLLVMLGVYLFTVGSFSHVQTSSGVQVQGHPGEQLPWGYCEVTFAHSS